MSYHLKEIEKGVLGELSKVYEEVEEVKDSEAQGVDVMVLCELADVIGAIEKYLQNKHPSITIHDLLKMKEVTERAFVSGRR